MSAGADVVTAATFQVGAPEQPTNREREREAESPALTSPQPVCLQRGAREAEPMRRMAMRT